MTTKGKILVLVSSGRGLPLKDGKVYTGAGYYLNELTVPVRALMKEGYEITFANPKGNAPLYDVDCDAFRPGAGQCLGLRKRWRSGNSYWESMAVVDPAGAGESFAPQPGENRDAQLSAGWGIRSSPGRRLCRAGDTCQPRDRRQA